MLILENRKLTLTVEHHCVHQTAPVAQLGAELRSLGPSVFANVTSCPE